MSVEQFRELLEQAAQGIMFDIRCDHGTTIYEGYDYGYECYTDPIPSLYQADFGADIIGVIYAGELGAWFYVPDGPDAIEMASVERELAAKLMPRIFGPGGIYELGF